MCELGDKFKDKQIKGDAEIVDIGKRNVNIKYTSGDNIEYVVTHIDSFLDRKESGRYHSFNLN